ncbi:MAG TPA: NADPH-dependent FMN reductase [Sphingomonas sp.]
MAIRIGIIVGSVRSGSHNQALADCIASALRARHAELWRPDAAALDLPIYHGDRERDDFPPAAKVLKHELAACAGLVLVSPEYNGSTSPLMKNVIDWTSRSTGDEPPLAMSAFRGKPLALASASIGPYGGVRALGHLRQIVQALQAIALPEEIRVPVASTAFEADGRLANPTAAAQLELVVDRLLDLAGRLA